MIIYPTVIDDKIDRFLQAHPFYPCCMLVHPDIAVLKAVSTHIQNYGWPFLDLNSLLAQILVTTAPQQRFTLAIQSFKTTIKRIHQSTVICSGINILFEPTLKIDPLRLFRDTSRQQQTRLIVLWPGTYRLNILAYATPKHSHYRSWSQPDLHFIIQLT